jgi:hypothetical protein
MKRTCNSIEVLESRIAPASVVHLTDANGDIITFKSTLGTLATSGPGQNVFDDGPLAAGHDQFAVNFGSSLVFNGTSLTVSVTKGPHGDGQLENLIIDASNLSLGSVSVAGDLGYIIAFQTGAAPAVKSLTVNSIGRFEADTAGLLETSSVDGSLGKLTIKHNMDGTFFDVTQDIGSVSIGGSLIGGGGDLMTDGDLFAGANMGNVSIKHDVRGGDEDYSGIVAAYGNLGAVTIGGSVYGGSGLYSGSIGGGTNVTGVAVGGSVFGGPGENSGDIYGAYHADGTVGKVTIGGSLVGSDGDYSGLVGYSDGGMFDVSLTTVVIGKDIVAGAGTDSGGVYANGSIGNLKLGGSLIGSSAANSPAGGFIQSNSQAGVIAIGGSIYGGTESSSGQVYLETGINKLSIGGSIYGGDGDSSGNVQCNGTIGVLNIGGDVIGGDGGASGSVNAGAVTTETIGGVVIPGMGLDSGTVTA